MEEPAVLVRTIEWNMMDKTKFFPLSMLSSFCVRASLYPLTLIKTRLQVQKHGQMYGGKSISLGYSLNNLNRAEVLVGLLIGF